MDKEDPKNKSAHTCELKNKTKELKKNREPDSDKSRKKPGALYAPGGAPLDISQSLQAPRVPNVNPDAITYEQAHAGVNVHIPGSPQMRCEDVIVFYWGLHRSDSVLHQESIGESVVRVLGISYNYLPHAQYGLVDLTYEVRRGGVLIGTSPTLRVTVNYSAPTTPRQRQRKRSVSRRYPGS